jgi:2-amino-4-hydroxy-6-hydroxymethyldihydropteridine diphosphokinase
MAQDAYIAVGSNIEPEKNILSALTTLKSKIIIAAISYFYRTSAVGKRQQPDFLNGVVKIQTDLSPHQLKFDVLRNIEQFLGRVRSCDKFAPRTIDLDLVVYDSLVVDVPDLHLPDPAIRLYPFVAIPLLEVAPELILSDTATALSTEPVIKLKHDLCPASEFTASLRHFILESQPLSDV